MHGKCNHESYLPNLLTKILGILSVLFHLSFIKKIKINIVEFYYLIFIVTISRENYNKYMFMILGCLIEKYLRRVLIVFSSSKFRTLTTSRKRTTNAIYTEHQHYFDASFSNIEGGAV